MCTNFFFNMASSRLVRNRLRYNQLSDAPLRSVSPASDFIGRDLIVTEDVTEDVTGSRGPKYGKRHNQIILLAMGTLLISIFNAYMSVCIVAMTDPTASGNKDVPTYQWKDKHLTLSSFFWGYCITHLFAGWLTDTCIGAKRLMVAAVLMNSFIGFLIPSVATASGSSGIIVCRFVQGLASGFHGSCLTTLFGKWIPSIEGTRVLGFIYSAVTAGIACSMFLSGQLSASKQGWPMVFYLTSVAGLLWAVVYGIAGYENSMEHPTITSEERAYIQENMSQDDPKDQKIPWKHIFTSSSFWALVLAECGVTFGHYLMLTEISNYLKNILQMDMETNGILSALPYVWALVLMYTFGWVADTLIRKRVFTTGGARKFFTFVGFVVPGIAFLVIGTSGPENATTAVIWLAIGIGVDMAAHMNGLLVNYIDLSPNYSCTLIRIANQFSQPFSILGPLAAHIFITDETNLHEWGTVFFTCLGFKAFTGIVFLLFGSGDVQPWNETETQKILRESNQNNREESQL